MSSKIYKNNKTFLCNSSFLLDRLEFNYQSSEIDYLFENKTVFITGGAGSIGSELVRNLLKTPVKNVIVFSHGENSVYELKCEIDDNRFIPVIGDVRDKNKLNHELQKYQPNYFFHVSAHKHVPFMEEYPDEAIKTNILGTYNCAMMCIINKVEKFILISTDKAVKPSSIMGASKKIAEKIVISLNKIQDTTKFSLVRFGNVLCSRGSVIPHFQKQIELNKPITITHQDMRRFFMSIPEAVRLILKSLTIKNGNTVILEMGEQLKIIDIANKLIKLYGTENPLVITGIREGEKLSEELVIDKSCILTTGVEKILLLNQKDIMIETELCRMIEAFTIVADTFNKDKIKATFKKYIKEYK